MWFPDNAMTPVAKQTGDGSNRRIKQNRKVACMVKQISVNFVRPLPIMLFLFFCSAAPAVCAVKTQFYPVLYMSGHYTDNKDRTATHKNETHHTVYGSNLLVRFVGKSATVDLAYNPEYIDRESDDEDGDSMEHNASLKASVQASPRVSMDLSLNYDDHDDGVDNESWAHTGKLTTAVALSRKTQAEMTLDYINAFERRQSTGTYQEHTDYGGSVVVIHQFGAMNQLSLSMDYKDVDYAPPLQEDYDSWAPGISLSYWLNPCWGIEVFGNYETIKYDLLNREVTSATGSLRFINCISPHFKFYSQYKHIHTRRDDSDEESYLPSLGFDWDVTKDAGVSLGVGYLYQEWDHQTNGRLFVDANVFKQVDLSRHANVVLTAASSIDPNSDDDADLGFQVQYRGGILFTWNFMENLSADFHGAWIRDEFTQPDVDRTDNTLELGGGVNWSPWGWATIVFAYSYEDFRTDSAQREDFHEHRGTVTFRLHPDFEWTGQGEVPTREDVETRIYSQE